VKLRKYAGRLRVRDEVRSFVNVRAGFIAPRELCLAREYTLFILLE
jgi:hypothetical protein